MQSKAGMFLRILGALAIVLFILTIFRETPSVVYYFWRTKSKAVEANIKGERWHELASIERKLKKDRKELYLSALPNDKKAEQKLQKINVDIHKNDEKDREIDSWLRQENLQGLQEREIITKLSISFFILLALLFLLKMYNKKHACFACQDYEGQKKGFLWTKLYSVIFYLGIIFGSIFIVLQTSFALKEKMIEKLSKETGPNKEREARQEMNAQIQKLSERGKKLRSQKNEILLSGDITRDGQNEILSIEQELVSIYDKLTDLTFVQRNAVATDGQHVQEAKKYTRWVNLFIVLLCLTAAWFIPLQFVQYLLVVTGMFMLISNNLYLQPAGSFALVSLFDVLYILAVILLFRRQKHICGTL